MIDNTVIAKLLKPVCISEEDNVKRCQILFFFKLYHFREDFGSQFGGLGTKKKVEENEASGRCHFQSCTLVLLKFFAAANLNSSVLSHFKSLSLR